MSDDELQVIEYWKEELKSYKKEIEQRQNDEFKGYGTSEDIAKLKYCNLHIILNLIEKQYKMIDEMAGEIIRILYHCNGKVGSYKTPYVEESISKTKENIKEYFKKKVEDK